ncbi:MAG: DUF2065 domain-containing protein [bacterium]
MWQDLLSAFALMLVIEGILPFLHPKRFRNMLKMLDQMDDNAVRWTGFFSMIAGAVILMMVR